MRKKVRANGMKSIAADGPSSGTLRPRNTQTIEPITA